MDREAAETIALRALVWLAQDDDLLGSFLGASGMSAGEVRMRAQDPDFMIAVLDFVTSASFVIAPVVALLNHMVVTRCDMPEEARPDTLVKAWNWVAIAVMGGLAVMYFVMV